MTPAIRLGLAAPAALLLTACGGIAVSPAAPEMPKPLIVQFPADVGVHYADDFRDYVHREERWGGKWQVTLGKSHVKLLDRVMGMTFRHFETVGDPKVAQSNQLLDLVLDPHIERYSFITPRDSGGDFFAVTIKYRLDVYAPDGRLADTLNLTGYGGAPAAGISSAKPLVAATQAAMRDAAAKFLVQFPEQQVARRLRNGEPLVQEKPATQVASADGTAAPMAEVKIEPVPIIDPPEEDAAAGSAQPPAQTPPAETKPEEAKPEEAKPEEAKTDAAKTGEAAKDEQTKTEEKKSDDAAQSEENKK